ncbi:TetR/AcrR family transcriptional regulator, partial [Phenylobacterium sp.]|uniref:TetR/AcrR family transcriptional regulator n=1 Tax=Phenylobacterium sp. TaxID=1871053 RepID=UPI002F41B4C2
MARSAEQGPRAQRGAARMVQIRVEASRLFVEKGYDGTSMQDIADAVGLTKAGLYHFVDSKEELLFLIVDAGVGRMEREVLEPARAVKDPRERLATLIRLHVENISRVESDVGNPVTSVVENLVGLSDQKRAEVNARLRQVFELTRGALDELKAQGRLTEGVDTTVAAFSITGMVMWTNRWRRPGGRLSSAD